MAKLLFTHAHLVVDDRREFIDGALLVENDRIKDVYPHANKAKTDEETKVIDLKGAYIFPGFFDTHTHGQRGIDFNHMKKEEMEKVSLSYAASGTTSFFVTLTDDNGQIEELKGAPAPYARFQGLHMEGPFINPKRKGAIEEKKLRLPDPEYIKDTEMIRQMTIAPELEGSKELIERLKERGIRVMIGHSEVSKDELMNTDYDGYTHLFNAMPPLSHRGGSILNRALCEDDDHYVELIADGQHIDLSVIKTALKLIEHNRIILISDSTLAAGMKDGEYPFLNETCIKDGMSFRRKSDGRFAGGVSSLLDQLKLLKGMGIDNTDLLAMTSLNACRFYGLDRQYGSLVKGRYADLVVLSSSYDLLFTYVNGKVIHV